MTRDTTERPLAGVAAHFPVLAVTLALVVAGSAAAAASPGQHAERGAPTATADAAPNGGPAQVSQTRCNYTRLDDEVSTAAVEIRAHNETSAWSGSGWVYRIDNSTAYVVTNWHLVEQFSPTDIDVRFESGRWSEAEVVGTNDLTDIAVVRVENVSESATALRIARRPPDRGQDVAVFGQPIAPSFRESITRGIVSGVNRSVTFPDPDVNRTIAPLLQTDAAIEPGNSGGPWVNCRGEVVAMTVGGYTSVTNFGISRQALRVVVPALLENGSYPLSYLGVETVDVGPIVAEVNGLNVTRGVMVADLASDSPAEGRLRPAPAIARELGRFRIPYGGDVVLAVDGVPVEDRSELYTHLYMETRPNETVNLTVLRDGRRRTVPVTLSSYPTLQPAPTEPQTPPSNETTPGAPPANVTTPETAVPPADQTTTAGS